MNQTLSVPLELKALSAREFEGHGSVFGNVDHGGDIVMPGAFKRSLAQHKKAGTLPQMFWMHRPDMVPGVYSQVEEDAKGLYVKGELVDTPLGNEMHVLLSKKAVRGLSIGFRTLESDFDRDGNRLLKELDLWEVSLVSLAMNPLAKIESVKARLSSAGEYVPTEREFERLLRDAGCSRKLAEIIAARFCADPDAGGTPCHHLRDAGEVGSEAEEALKSILRLTDMVGAAALTR